MSLQIEDYTGAIPVIISLSDTDCSVQEKPAPLMYVLPRTSVLMAVRTEVQNYFSAFTVAKADSTPLVWLTCKGEPVPWQYPVGAIKDSINASVIAGLCEPAKKFITTSTDTIKDTLASPAELYPTVFALPLTLEARITCLATEKPFSIPCPGQEDAASRRNGEQAVSEYLKQVMKGTFSLMYGSIKALMDTRSEVINDVLSLATCTSTGDPFIRALRAYNDRVAGLRRVTGEPQNIALMLNVPLGKNPLHFALFRVPTMIGSLYDEKTSVGEQNEEVVPSGNDNNNNNNNNNNSSMDLNKEHVGSTKPKISVLEMPFGEVIWRALLEPYLMWRKFHGRNDDGTSGANSNSNNANNDANDISDDSASTLLPCSAPILRALTPFYRGLEDKSSSSSTLYSGTESLVREFIAAADATDEEKMIHVVLPSLPRRKRRLSFMLQGLQPPLQTPVGYLLERFTSADGRLYVTLVTL
ncbi:uncharacterized protein TM35_000073970 [Trypanosoma theileri]|uniref:Autophagy protein 5 n=1 Tax=Trypanosoma theileri TaxID=67003 RepID=A0A1X0P2Q3_9TRYP|nr:uncharacterized protein TM35_000073970 [Trypanosoma theileri]ORC90973.1 hypothetical protein TM35_000073970 [Trypanosoma theileri]